MSEFKKQVVGVYGTLRQGNGNHRLLENAQLIGSGFLEESATMYSNGGFPILSFDPEVPRFGPIRVELYEVSDQRTMDRLDSLEGYPQWYNRTEREFKLDDGRTMTAWIYHQDKAFELPIIESGDWQQRPVLRRGW